jgi:hypothetical protein
MYIKCIRVCRSSTWLSGDVKCVALKEFDDDWNLSVVCESKQRSFARTCSNQTNVIIDVVRVFCETVAAAFCIDISVLI